MMTALTRSSIVLIILTMIVYIANSGCSVGFMPRPKNKICAELVMATEAMYFPEEINYDEYIRLKSYECVYNTRLKSSYTPKDSSLIEDYMRLINNTEGIRWNMN